MPVPSGLASLSQTAASNSPAGSDNVFPSLDDYLREIFADLARLRDGANTILAGVAGTDTITATSSQITSYVKGQFYAFVSAGSNATTSVTLNISTIGAKNVLRPDASAIAVGDIASGALVVVFYDGTQFLIAYYGVNLTSAQTIGGAKTFSLAPASSVAASVSNELMRKNETTDLSSNQTVSGKKTFSTVPVFSAAPSFSAYQGGSAQVLGASTWTKVQLQNEEFDLTNAFDSATNYRFTPLVSGYYQINGCVNFVGASQIYTAIYKNGAEVKSGNRVNGSGVASNVSALIYMNGTTDYLELWVISSATSTLVNSASGTYFQGVISLAT